MTNVTIIFIDDRKQAYFVDLFVRVSNIVAIDMYKKLGYSVYRQVLEYYTGDPDEDAYGNPIDSSNCNSSIVTIIFHFF